MNECLCNLKANVGKLRVKLLELKEVGYRIGVTGMDFYHHP